MKFKQSTGSLQWRGSVKDPRVITESVATVIFHQTTLRLHRVKRVWMNFSGESEGWSQTSWVPKSPTAVV